MVNQISGAARELKVNSGVAISGQRDKSACAYNAAEPARTAKLPPDTLAEGNSPGQAAADVRFTPQGKEQLVQDNIMKADEKEKQAFTKADVEEMSTELTKFMNRLNCNLEFNYYEKVGQIGVKMVDKKTKEVIKEFPPEKIIEAMIKTKEWIGVFLDKKI